MSFAEGHGDGGWHAHMLVWEEPYITGLIRHAVKAGLGRIDVKPIHADPMAALAEAVYVLGQTESVFGTDIHERHRERPVGARRFSHSQASTLKKHHPELLHALELAKDPALTDQMLFSALPIFIKE
jgi:hypothetical protein